MFNVWVEDIQVIGLPAAITPFEIQRCFLPKVRAFARYSSLFVVLLFALHCTSPRSSITSTTAPGVPPEGRPDDPPEETAKVYTEHGQASWYGGDDDGFAGGVTANGEIYDPSALTCAHRTLPFGTMVEVENLSTGKRTVLRVNDRGPFIRGRILDMSQRGAKDLGILHHGVANVRLRTVDAKGKPAPVDPGVLQGNPYTIQVAALANPANIERISRELQAAYGPVTYQVVQGSGGITIKRIRVGTYPRLEMAQQATEKLAKFCKDRGLDSFIIRQY
ncbi:MAG: septal ring lytic transglycosylase RlpA family protein [Holophaga sp.]|nr:septal ring lytic transglycosylase RlpA family protein [Holophaga sp.]